MIHLFEKKLKKHLHIIQQIQKKYGKIKKSGKRENNRFFDFVFDGPISKRSKGRLVVHGRFVWQSLVLEISCFQTFEEILNLNKLRSVSAIFTIANATTSVEHVLFQGITAEKCHCLTLFLDGKVKNNPQNGSKWYQKRDPQLRVYHVSSIPYLRWLQLDGIVTASLERPTACPLTQAPR